MKRNARRVAALVLTLFVLAQAINAYALVSLVLPVGRALLWTGRFLSGSTSLATAETVVAAERSLALHGAILGALWWGSNDTQSKNAEKGIVWVPLDPTATRSNPDPKRYDDAPMTIEITGVRNRDVKPKASYAGEADKNVSSTPTNGAVAAAMPAGSSMSYAVEGQNNIREYKSVDIALYSGSSDLQKCSSAQASTNPGTGWVFTCPAGVSSDGKTVGLWTRVSTAKTCAAGYTLTNGNCVLTDAASVKKPEGKVACEVLVDATNNTFQFDAANPSCSSALANFSKPSPNQLRYNPPSGGGYDIITRNADGSTTIETSDGTNYKKITVGPFDKGQGGGTIRTIDTGLQPGTDGTGGGGGSGGGGSGASGNGTGNCGGPGQSPCAVTVDDSGFQGKDPVINAAADNINAKLDERRAFIESKGNDSSNFGLDKSWIPSFLPGSPVSCRPIKWEPRVSHGPLAGLAASIDIDWCENLDVFRQYYAWLFGVVTAWGIVMLFFGSNGNTGRSGK
ncbi:hypothetical protein [Ralstonia mannitolilytica]|uniref:hypothetical protein n=1 Tax=Ralstonia mannitolilytica TaxID=105219 RepID=UPI0028F59CF0|nr:hypothetical protein [Ralstonia mannitolilytica]CAJ0733965.1 hypothetical protein R76696_00552 [Ralstonia mannitolilytica]